MFSCLPFKKDIGKGKSIKICVESARSGGMIKMWQSSRSLALILASLIACVGAASGQQVTAVWNNPNHFDLWMCCKFGGDGW